MTPENRERIERLRDHVREERAAIAELDVKLTDAGVKEMLRRASFWLDDVETLFIGSLQRED